MSEKASEAPQHDCGDFGPCSCEFCVAIRALEADLKRAGEVAQASIGRAANLEAERDALQAAARSTAEVRHASAEVWRRERAALEARLAEAVRLLRAWISEDGIPRLHSAGWAKEVGVFLSFFDPAGRESGESGRADRTDAEAAPRPSDAAANAMRAAANPGGVQSCGCLCHIGGPQHEDMEVCLCEPDPAPAPVHDHPPGFDGGCRACLASTTDGGVAPAKTPSSPECPECGGRTTFDGYGEDGRAAYFDCADASCSGWVTVVMDKEGGP